MCQSVIDPVAQSGSQGWTWITSPGGHDSENPLLRAGFKAAGSF